MSWLAVLTELLPQTLAVLPMRTGLLLQALAVLPMLTGLLLQSLAVLPMLTELLLRVVLLLLAVLTGQRGLAMKPLLLPVKLAPAPP